jgi:hypothetical protein
MTDDLRRVVGEVQRQMRADAMTLSQQNVGLSARIFEWADRLRAALKAEPPAGEAKGGWDRYQDFEEDP